MDNVPNPYPEFLTSFTDDEAMELLKIERPECLIPPQKEAGMGFYLWVSEEGHHFSALVHYTEGIADEARATRLDAKAPEDVKQMMVASMKAYARTMETIAMVHDVVSAIESMGDGECDCSVCRAKKRGRISAEDGDDSIGLRS